MQRGLVSIIIATHNVRDLLEKCLRSIGEQSYAAREIIIMDAASSDGTVEFLTSVDRDIHFWESQADKGIYDAWNKALLHANGEWICFIGGDDVYASVTSLEQLVDAGTATNAVFVSGRAILEDDAGRPIMEWGDAWNWRRLRTSQDFCHVGALHHRSLFDKYGGFDSEYRIAGDYDFLLRLPIDAAAAYVPAPVVRVGSSGVSRQHRLKVYQEKLAIQKSRPEIGSFRAYRHYYWTRFKYFIKPWVQRVWRVKPGH